jgi:hypothetical protein
MVLEHDLRQAAFPGRWMLVKPEITNFVKQLQV